MKIKFQADADLNEDIVSGVLRCFPAIDFQTATEAALEGIPDDQVLERAAQSGRVLVSHDRRTMPRHFAGFIQTKSSPGVLIVSKKRELRLLIEDLCLVWLASEPEEYINSIRQIPL